jgi:hypothetical protein
MKNWNVFLELSQKRRRSADDSFARMDDQNLSDFGARLRRFFVHAAQFCGEASSGLGSGVLHDRAAPAVHLTNPLFVAFQSSYSNHQNLDGTRITVFPSSCIGGCFCGTTTIGSGGYRPTLLACADLAGGVPCVGCGSGGWQLETRLDLTRFNALFRRPMGACLL